jgi:uncharacterized repeat protein (TIGR01451 family)
VNPDLAALTDAPASSRYSYSFDGNAQSLDHALVNASLVAASVARRLEHARISADFPETARDDATTATRLSDHDPLLVYLQVGAFASADLAVTKVDTPDPIVPGATLSYTVTVSNNGPDPAPSTTWTDTLPTGTSFVSLAAPAGWSCTTPALGSSGTVTCSAASFALASAQFTLDVAVGSSLSANTLLSNTATVSSAATDDVSRNNSATSTTTVRAADTSTAITGDSPDPSVYGQAITVTYAVTVTSPSVGTPTGNVTVSDGTDSCTGTVAAGSCLLTPLTPGARSLTATYAGDANFNGSTSAAEAHGVTAVKVYSAASPAGHGNIVAAFTGGGPDCTFSRSAYTATLPAAAPTGVRFPHGVFDFALKGCTGSPVNFTITYPAALPAGSQYWKYGPTADDHSHHWYTLNALDNNLHIVGNVVTFSIADGGRGDDDLLANGEITDQGGPGYAVGGNPVPSLSEWGVILLSLLLLGSAYAAGRQRIR